MRVNGGSRVKSCCARTTDSRISLFTRNNASCSFRKNRRSRVGLTSEAMLAGYSPRRALAIAFGSRSVAKVSSE